MGVTLIVLGLVFLGSTLGGPHRGVENELGSRTSQLEGHPVGLTTRIRSSLLRRGGVEWN